jgi:hypothetical protein
MVLIETTRSSLSYSLLLANCSLSALLEAVLARSHGFCQRVLSTRSASEVQLFGEIVYLRGRHFGANLGLIPLTFSLALLGKLLK